MKITPPICNLHIISYCDIVEEIDIPENHWINHNSSDCYVKYSLTDNDPISSFINNKYDMDGIDTVLIHIDY